MPCPLHAVAGGARRRESVSISVRPAPGEGTAGQVPRAGWQLAQSDCHLLTASTLHPCLQSSLSSPSTLPARSTRRTYSRLSVCLCLCRSVCLTSPPTPPPLPTDFSVPSLLPSASSLPVSVDLFFCRSRVLAICLSVCLSACLTISLSILSVSLLFLLNNDNNQVPPAVRFQSCCAVRYQGCIAVQFQSPGMYCREIPGL